MSHESLREGKFALHVAGDRTYVLELSAALVVFDPGFDGRDGPTLGNVVALAEVTGKPLRLLFVSHAHFDHAENLPLFLEAARWRPDLFDFVVAAHPAGRLLDGCPRRQPITERSAVDLDGERIEFLPTPGHNRLLDDLCLYLPDRGLLFAGDLVQPQGPTYECCTCSTPVSNHARPDLVIPSLEALAALPFTTLLMGHDGTVLDREAGLSAIGVTLSTLRREEELAREFAWRQSDLSSIKGLTVDRLTERVFDRIAAERGLSASQIENRKIEGHNGPCVRLGAKSYYRLYDAPSIRWFAKATLGQIK